MSDHVTGSNRPSLERGWDWELSAFSVGDAAISGSDSDRRLHHAAETRLSARHSTSVLLRSDMGASRSKAAFAPRCGRIIASSQGWPASVAARMRGQHHPQAFLAPLGNALTLGRAADAHVLLPAPEGMSRTNKPAPGLR